MQEWIKVSVSSLFLENGTGDAIFGSLKDRTGGVDRMETRDGETHGGVGNGREPDGCGGE